MSDNRTLDIQLLKWQQKVWEDRTRFHIIAAGRRSGKSRYAAWKMLVKALKSTKGHVFYVAPTQGQARDIMWGLLLELGAPVIKSAHVNNMQITLINGAIISLKGADRPDTMRGVSLAYLVLDEYADMKPQVFEEVLRPALADQKAECLFIGTPKGRNHFYELYKYAELEDDEDFRAWHFTSYDNETLDPEEIDRAKKSMSSQAFRQEFMASFEASGSEIFKEEWLSFSEEAPKDADSYYIAIDLAGFQEVGRKKDSRLDNTSICVVKAGESGWFVENIITGRWTLEQTAQKIFQAVRDYRPLAVGIEKGIAKQAVISPLQDMMKRYGFFFNIEELTHSNQKKIDRITWALQGRFEHGLITLRKADWNIQFIDELLQFPSPLTHDDMVDALAYIDQLAKIAYIGDAEIQQDYDDIGFLDEYSGY